MKFPDLTLPVLHFNEPLLEFASQQTTPHPKDGLFLYGPFNKPKKIREARIGVIGTQAPHQFPLVAKIYQSELINRKPHHSSPQLRYRSAHPRAMPLLYRFWRPAPSPLFESNSNTVVIFTAFCRSH